MFPQGNGGSSPLIGTLLFLNNLIYNCTPSDKLEKNARVVKWYTRTLEVRMPKGVEVQVLSRAHSFSKKCMAA